jgi:demethylmenaquinone methyltransferase / 2-methoxy-6-polyprenyl-1,4-benzoquinol methylase
MRHDHSNVGIGSDGDVLKRTLILVTVCYLLARRRGGPAIGACNRLLLALPRPAVAAPDTYTRSVAAVSPRRQHAQALFAPLGPTYDRYASLLSFGQDPRWRRFLVSRTQAGPGDTVLDVATGTGAVAAELLRQKGCTVVGVDQSTEMLAEATPRLPAEVELVEGDADHLPFPDASFAALTFTYLMRYVDDPAATLRELARVVRPGGTLAGLEFGVPPNPVARVAWRFYVGVGLPTAGRLISPGWREVGEFLGPSIEGLWARLPLERLLELWRSAGIEDVRARRLSLGGGVVIWGRRA